MDFSGRSRKNAVMPVQEAFKYASRQFSMPRAPSSLHGRHAAQRTFPSVDLKLLGGLIVLGGNRGDAMPVGGHWHCPSRGIGDLFLRKGTAPACGCPRQPAFRIHGRHPQARNTAADMLVSLRYGDFASPAIPAGLPLAVHYVCRH